jgi:hypothetical protein
MGFGAVGKIFVDRDLGEIGPQNVGACLEDDRDQRNRYLETIGSEVRQQALHQPAVIRFAQYFLLVDCGHAYGTILAKSL